MMTGDRIVAGIDVGSRSTKAVVLRRGEVVGRSLIATGWTPKAAIDKALKEALGQAGASRAARVIATGYGRGMVEFADRRVTEITAHGRGVTHLLPSTRTIIDIGGQDSKAIIIAGGLVEDFAMNDRCAAGSGKFLEFLAATMNLPVAEFAELAYKSDNPTNISSICTVFAESEALSLLAEGVSREDAAAGVHRAIAWRVAQLALPLHPQPPFAFSGGAARNRCLVRELSHILKHEIIVPPFPEFAGALGAGLIGEEM